MTSKTEWVQVDALAEGFAKEANTLEHVEDLTGKTFVLNSHGLSIAHTFGENQHLTWEVLEGEEKGARGEATYTSTCLREGIYFVDFIKPEEFATSASIVLNLKQQTATILVGQMPTEQEAMRPVFQRVKDGDYLTGVKANFIQCTVNRPVEGKVGHEETLELVGKRVQYEYSPHEFYDHIYLSSGYYTWHCLKGVEKGLAETEMCHYLKIDQNLFFFVWREKVIPTLGVIMIDLERMKTTGKILGFDGTSFSSVSNFPVGAKATVMNAELAHKMDG
ncbi:molybdenum cofactor biosynthesis F family protein [Vibrio sp. SCSIO 43136]|uniref:molybdenum cofactor biosynthesis F family protein n=1 Tax=Vibrio sp. SCSIO 43136 TaxID=2819101 RepID=UPI0020759012|nr:molybdenum cofactor biosynthesis F family protein [Vibrio sp. SCSIO 43136]USD67432.1 molybdenum cofactor biosynthesis F family protein [Vibrio sp. SCSIO 43136]